MSMTPQERPSELHSDPLNIPQPQIEQAPSAKPEPGITAEASDHSHELFVLLTTFSKTRDRPGGSLRYTFNL